MIEYLIESFLCLLALCLLFELFFKRSRHYRINRVVLLFSVLFSLIVPLFSISTTQLSFPQSLQSESMIQVISLVNYLPNTPSAPLADSDLAFDPLFLLSIVYTIVVLFLFLRLILHLSLLVVRGWLAERTTFDGHELRLIDEEVTPFTFFHSIFVSRKSFENQILDRQLILHEIAHKSQWHTIDILFIELVQVFFWFNPMVYIIKRWIRTNHEYLADDFVLRSGVSQREYAEKLLQHTFPDKYARLVSGFNHLLIKKRLIMLTKFQSKRPSSFRFLLLLPVVSLLFTATAFSNVAVPDSVIPGIENNLDEEGTLQADKIVWSSEDNKVYLHGKNIRVKHGDNDFKVNGRASYLGEVHCLVVDGKTVAMDSPIDVKGKSCKVVKWDAEAARKKFGKKGQKGAVEIWSN